MRRPRTRSALRPNPRTASGAPLVQLACELLAWTQMLGFPAHPAQRWKPKRLRLRLFSIAGQLAHHARRLVAHLAAGHPWTALVLTGRAAITAITARPG